MASDRRSAIALCRQPQPSCDERNVLTRGWEYNRLKSSSLCAIRIWAGTPVEWAPQKPFMGCQLRLDCQISTDSWPTVFQGKIAKQLELQPDEPVLEQVSTFGGPYKGWWSRHRLWLSIGLNYLDLEVWFPVESGSSGWEWRDEFPQSNVLGMGGVLDRRMLCLTSEQVFVFEKRPQQ